MKEPSEDAAYYALVDPDCQLDEKHSLMKSTACWRCLPECDEDSGSDTYVSAQPRGRVISDCTKTMSSVFVGSQTSQNC